MPGLRHVNPSHRNAIVVILITLLFPLQLVSADTERVLAVIKPRTGSPDAGLENVLSSFITIELESAGLEPVSVPEDATLQEVNVTSLARETEAAYVLTVIYQLEGDQAALEFSSFEGRRSEPVTTVSRAGPVDLQFDALVTGAINEIIDRTGVRRAPESADTVDTPIDPGADGPVPRQWAFTAAASTGPFLVNGQASDYFKFGLFPSVFAGFTTSLLEGHISAGVNLAYGRFVTTGELSDVLIQAAPFGLEVRYGTAGDLPVNIFVRTAVGTAVLQLDSGDGWQSKLVGYGSFGMGASRIITARLEIGLEASYVLLVEETHPIMGFTPALSIITRM